MLTDELRSNLSYVPLMLFPVPHPGTMSKPMRIEQIQYRQGGREIRRMPSRNTPRSLRQGNRVGTAFTKYVAAFPQRVTYGGIFGVLRGCYQEIQPVVRSIKPLG